jgi:hypothetical protein
VAVNILKRVQRLEVEVRFVSFSPASNVSFLIPRSSRLAWLPTDPLILFNLACCASATGRIEEAKLHLGHAVYLDENVQGLALDDEDLGPVWDWITEAP